MAGQNLGGWTKLAGKAKVWQDAIDADSLDEYRKKFDSIEKNIEKVEKYLSWPEDLNQTVSVSEEFMKFFGLKK